VERGDRCGQQGDEEERKHRFTAPRRRAAACPSWRTTLIEG
jgi:hypothetical protein